MRPLKPHTTLGNGLLLLLLASLPAPAWSALLPEATRAELLQAVPHCAAVREATANGHTLWEYQDRHSRTLPAVHRAYEHLIATILEAIRTEPIP